MDDKTSEMEGKRTDNDVEIKFELLDTDSKINLLLKQNISLMNTVKESNETIHKKLDGVKHDVLKIGERVSTLENRVDVWTQQCRGNKEDLDELKTVVGDVENSCKFNADEYDRIKKLADDNQTAIVNLQIRCTELGKENAQLQGKFLETKNELDQERTLRNTDAQYLRTSVNIKLCGLPLQTGEDIRTPTPTNPVTEEIVRRTWQAAGIQPRHGYDFGLDVCHRLGSAERCPIIIRFSSKSARYHVFNQRDKLKNISTMDINFDGLPHIETKNDRRGAREPPPNRPPGDTEQHDIYFQEHLTKHTKNILTTARTALKKLNYEYPGYIKDGEVRAKRNENDRPTVIRSMTDLRNIPGVMAQENEETDNDGDPTT